MREVIFDIIRGKKMLINKHVRILEKHLNSLRPNLNICFYVSRRSKYVRMGLDCALFTLKDHISIIAEIKDFMFDKLDKRFTYCFPQLTHTVKWKYDYIIFKKKVNGNNVILNSNKWFYFLFS